MKNTIIMWAMLVLLSFLTACGGSDSDGSFGRSETPGEGDPGDDPGNGDDPQIIPEDNTLIALGTGSGTAFVPSVARTGLNGTSLSASGSTSVSVDLVDLNAQNAQFLGIRDVTFSSTCTAQGLAEFSPASVKASGTATSTYKDKGCGKEFGATDNIVVYIEQAEGAADNPNATARTSINVQAAKIGAIQYLSAEPSLIALSGYGAGEVPSLSNVTFQVLDSSGNSMPDRTVRFSLDHDLGGDAGGAQLSLAEAVTDADGTVNVILNSGAVAGNIRVKAEIDIKNTAGTVTDTISTMSVPITMATSLGDQNSFSLSAEVQNPNAWAVDGETVEFAVQVGDHNQNPVIDGTRVFFRASGGLIEPSCETQNGACSISWTSSNPRPVDGYVTITAFTRGQGDFQDLNSNGLYDVNIRVDGVVRDEPFTTYGEQYIDANGSGTYDTNGAYQPNVDIDNDGVSDFLWNPDHYMVYVDSQGVPVSGSEDVNFLEEFVDSNGNGNFDPTPANFYQGANCSDAAFAAGHCAEQINLVGSARIQMSQGNNVFIEGPFPWDAGLGRYDTDTVLTCVDASWNAGAQSVAWRVSDSQSRRNHLPAGTTIGFDTDEVEVLSSSFSGEVASVAPASTWPLRAGTPALTAQQKYDYLNARGHFISASIIREDDIDFTTSLGTVAMSINTLDGGLITGGTLNVDWVGFVAGLSENNFPRTLVDVENGQRTYTVKVRNRCLEGLPVGAVLQVSLGNGQFDAVTASGGANNASLVWDGSSATVDINDDTQTAILNLTISSDGVSDEAANALDISYYVSSGSDITVYDLGDYNVND